MTELMTSLRGGASGVPARVILPPHWAIVKRLRVPAVEPAKRERIIAFEVQQNVPWPSADVVWDHAVRREVGPELEIEVVAARREVVERLGEWADALGIQVSVITPSSLVGERVLRMQLAGGADPGLLLSLGAASSEVVLVEGAEAIHRTVAFGGDAITTAIAAAAGCSWREAEARKIRGLSRQGPATSEGEDTIVLEALRAWWDRLRLEVVRVLAAHRKHGGSEPRELWLIGGAMTAGPLVEMIEAKTRLRVRIFEPAVEGTIPGFGALELRPDQLARLSTLARADFDNALNLVPRPRRERWRRARRRPWWFATAATLAVAQGVLAFAWEKQLGAVRAETEALAQARVAARGAQRRIEEARASWQLAEDALAPWEALSRTRGYWLELLEDLETRLGETGGAWFDRVELVPAAEAATASRKIPAPFLVQAPAPRPPALPSHRSLRVRGWLFDPTERLVPTGPRAQTQFQRLLANLGASSYIQNVETERLEAAAAGLLRFELALLLASPGEKSP